jgi:hypothetical protein
VDPSASALLDILVEIGHLDEKLLSEVNDRLLDLQASDGVVDLQAARRVAATVIFEHETELDPELQRIIGAEWGLLFH